MAKYKRHDPRNKKANRHKKEYNTPIEPSGKTLNELLELADKRFEQFSDDEDLRAPKHRSRL